MTHFNIGIKIFLYLLIWVGVASCNMDQHITPDEPVLSQEDETFIVNATYANLIGIAYADLAEERSTSGLILAYAQRMKAEHTTAQNVLGAMANDFDVMVPGGLPSQQQSEWEQLAGSSGSTFDSMYIQRNIENHLWSQDIMEGHIHDSNVEELVQYAGQQLQQVNERLNDALVIQSELP
jgi:putative membrane protein